MFTRRTFLAGGSAALATLVAMPARAAPIPLATLSQYLNNIRTARSDFTQINADGTISTGTIYIHRPGRVRFDYNPPDETLVMAGGGQVAIFDGKSNSRTPEQYPLARTPLNIILEANVNFARAGMVSGHREDGVKTIVTAQDPQNPEYGRIELVFTPGPVELRQWVITDNAGTQTTVILAGLTTGVSIPASSFSIPTEIRRRS